MKLDLVKRPAAVITELLDAAAEHPVECDILLPDYCPDIVRVLTCRAETDVTGRSVNGATLTVDGMTIVTLCYLGEVGGVRKTTVRQPFSKSFELSSAPAAPVVFASAQKSALSCRAVSRRRVDVRGTLQISATVYDAGTTEVISETGNGTLCLLTEEIENECITDNVVSRISLREEVTPTAGVERIAEIVRCECQPIVSEWRAVSGGVLFKGELLVSILAACEEEKLVSMKYSLPVSKLAESRNPESVRAVTLRCAFAECQLTDDESGRLSVEMQLEASLLHEAKTTLTAAKDAFSTVCDHEQTQVEISQLAMRSQLKEKLRVEAKTALPDGADTVCDVCASVSQLSSKTEDGEVKITGRVTFAALLSGGEGGVQAVSASTLFEKSVMAAGEGEFICKADAAVLSSDAALNEDGVSFDAEILAGSIIMEKRSQKVLGTITLNESSPIVRDESIGLMIRYADDGERVWDIASHYAVSPDDIMRDNELSSDVITEPSVLIIPAPRA